MTPTEARTRRLELLILVFWLAKDFCWVLLSALPALLTVVVAVCLHCKVLMVASSRFTLLHELAGVFWLCGNTLWMSAEFCFSDPKGNKTLTRTLEAMAYERGLVYGRCCLCVGLLGLLGSYLAYAIGSWSLQSRHATRSTLATRAASDLEKRSCDAAGSDAQEPPLVLGLLTPHEYAQLFMAPWILKDVMWTYSLFLPAISCWMIVIAHLMDCLRLGISVDTVRVELLWALANLVWMIDEVPLHDRHLWMRICAAGVLFIGVGWALERLMNIQEAPRKAASKSQATESTPLMEQDGR